MKKLLGWAASDNGSAVGGLLLSATLLSGSGFYEAATVSWWGLLLAGCVAVGACEVFQWGARAALRKWEKKA